MTPRTFIALSLLIAISLPRAQAKVQAKDATLGFSFDLPVGFVEGPKPTPDMPGYDASHGADIVEVFAHSLVAQKVGMIVAVTRLHHLIEPGTPMLTQSTTGEKVEVSEENWKSIKVAVGRVAETVQGVSMITYNIQVPLTPEAIQISVSAPADHEKRLKPVIRTILSSLDGKTNWTGTTAAAPVKSSASSAPAANEAPPLSAEERGRRFGRGIAMFIIFVSAVTIGVKKLMKKKSGAA